MSVVRRPLRGRQAPTGHRPSAGPQPEAPDAGQPRRAAVRRRPVGRAGPVGARPVRRPHARARRRGLLRPGPARRGTGRRARGRRPAHRARRVRVRRRAGLVEDVRACLRAIPPDVLGASPDRRPDGRRVGARPRPAARDVAHRGRDRRRVDVRPAAAAEHAVHARLVVLDLRRRLDQPDVLAGPPPRGLQHGRHLSSSPHVQGRGFEYWYPPLGRRRALPVEDFGLASLEGGDVEIIGKGRSRSACPSGRQAG